ncbi:MULTISPECIES: 2OG-Fe dioxygenase family protein [unclassified Leptolyngbya]|uniref:2OG-Fe dioxygenase family protein n=1 Tax=unclassified Leptolyngbya TaxID=2650499 RepID=UPI0016869B4E|nr:MULTISPECIES: 2OG-Fe dioxygenase family protein [unclassified Leptolyngbya]MBD1909105.1 2OG-Fe dioxygenase family protein [Leptolyngbya sp. FACHB-8]MBD2158562.1 2OG-Fe dioxygenase family protein [Leptolyngbya sp. FACHB-16]
MLNASKTEEFIKPRANCLVSYILEMMNAIKVEPFELYFDRLPADPYLEGNYRFRRLSHFKILGDRLIQLPHRQLFQSKTYNPILGDVIREYEELEDGLIQQVDFQAVIWEFYQYCQVCSRSNEIAVHQIRTTASLQKLGNPAPEGIHRDGVTLVGIFSVHRQGVEGAETHLYQSKENEPIFSKVLNPGEFLIFKDDQYFHYTSPIKTTGDKGVRDVFVLTNPGLFPPESGA